MDFGKVRFGTRDVFAQWPIWTGVQCGGTFFQFHPAKQRTIRLTLHGDASDRNKPSFGLRTVDFRGSILAFVLHLGIPVHIYANVVLGWPELALVHLSAKLNLMQPFEQLSFQYRQRGIFSPLLLQKTPPKKDI